MNCPPPCISRYEDAFNRFIDDINPVAAYEWWEGSVHSILSVVAYPCAWSWKQWRQRNKIHRLKEYVKAEYDHSCLRSCRSRALYKGMKVWLAVLIFQLPHLQNFTFFPGLLVLNTSGYQPLLIYSDMVLAPLYFSTVLLVVSNRHEMLMNTIMFFFSFEAHNLLKNTVL